jgi:phytoene synthase
LTDPLPHPDLPPGSADYYAARFGPEASRRAVGAILVWGRTLESVASDTSDPGVARLKLQWWGEELRRTAQERARHPLARELQPVLTRSPQRLALCLDIVEAQDERARAPGTQTLEALVERGRRTRGALLSLTVLEAGGTSDEARAARSLGAAIELVRTVRDLGAELRRGRCPLPRRLLEARGLAAVPSPDDATLADLRPVLQETGQRARALCAEALEDAPAGRLPALATPLALAEIHLELLDAVEETGFRVLDRRIRLTAMRKLWKGLQAARKARRGIRRRTR